MIVNNAVLKKRKKKGNDQIAPPDGAFASNTIIPSCDLGFMIVVNAFAIRFKWSISSSSRKRTSSSYPSVWVRNTPADERGSEENVRDCNPIHNAFGHRVGWATEADDRLDFLSALNLFHQQSVSTLTGGCSALRIILTALWENRVSEIHRHRALITRSPRDRVRLILMGYTKLLTATWF